VARIKDSSVREVRDAVDMVELVGQYTPLRRVGGRYTGRCPFHEERTPSFSVDPANKLFHCFGCGKGGDAISFVREQEQLDFAEAVEWLAERFRVTLEYEETSPRLEEERRRRDRLFGLLDQAARFYERFLWESPAGGAARDYLAGRGLREEVCREYRLGLSPGGTVLARKALEKSFTRGELAAAGLVNRRGNDWFARRLVFPLADARGRVLGFGARRMHEDDPLKAKYVNSPEGELFHKASIVYGLDRARAAIAKQERALVVEGYTDVLALRQTGLEPVVASMGTALTDRQLRELGRLARRLFLCFDADAAGEAATLRGMELAVGQGFDVRVVPLPPGLDPADAADQIEGLVARAEAYALYRVRVEIQNAPDRQAAYERARDTLDRLPESPERQDAWRYANDKLGMTVQIRAAAAGTAAAGSGVSPRVVAAGERLEREALAGCLAHPELVPLLAELTPDHFDTDPHRRFREVLVSGGDPPDELVPLRAELGARAAAEEIDETTAKQLLLRLRERRLRRELAAADLERTPELQEALTQIREAVQALS
jgi:DNA primase